MRVERKIGKFGEITDIIHLDNSEVEALDQAHEIIRERCLQEGVPYDKEAIEYWLEGILRCEGVDKVLHMARNAPFARKKTTRSVGYAGKTEVEE
ncbi:MAG: hypothetical protein E7607_01095 [Ruminococcaceae bacterium]|nr:hypothetical protein [Oscillospiraceae bacterium]